MKKFIKNNIKLLIGIIIGLILGGSAIYVVATTYYSNNVVYNNANSTLTSTNVQDALDELYTKSVGPIITSVVDNEDLTATVNITVTVNPVDSVCVNTNSKVTSNCSWKSVSGTSFTTNAVASAGNYYIHVQDTGGRITHSSSVSLTKASMTGLELVASHPANLSTSLVAELYRYQGTASEVTNNYICFGTTDSSTCTSDTDKYMYRIIGITEDGKMKLIKKEALNTAYARYSDCAEYWNNSTLYSGLNDTYFLNDTNYVPNGWSTRISTLSWHYINYFGVGYSHTASDMATHELSGSTVNAKIGLIYLHDYYYGLVGGNNCYSSGNTCLTSWIHLFNNDSGAPNSNEWSMNLCSQSSGGSVQANKDSEYKVELLVVGQCSYGMDVYILSTGSVESIAAYRTLSVRPSFYLNSTEEIVSGIGTIGNPYMLG